MNSDSAAGAGHADLAHWLLTNEIGLVPDARRSGRCRRTGLSEGRAAAHQSYFTPPRIAGHSVAHAAAWQVLSPLPQGSSTLDTARSLPGRTEARARRRQRGTPGDAGDAGAYLLDLLVGFIGEELTLRLVGEVWPDLPLLEPIQPGTSEGQEAAS